MNIPSYTTIRFHSLYTIPREPKAFINNGLNGNVNGVKTHIDNPVHPRIFYHNPLKTRSLDFHSLKAFLMIRATLNSKALRLNLLVLREFQPLEIGLGLEMTY